MRYSLITEGPTDRILGRPIDWLLDLHCVGDYSGEWANPNALLNPSRDLQTRLANCKTSYPCDVAFVHRDSDTAGRAHRVTEITDAVAASGYSAKVICTVPVRMTEAWFIFNEDAIRRAADRPRSNVNLALPTNAEAERRADPKLILENALVAASELSGRKLKSFRADLGRRKALVATHIDDFSPLRDQPAFRNFENDVKNALRELGRLRE